MAPSQDEVKAKRAELVKYKEGLAACIKRASVTSGEMQAKYFKGIAFAEVKIADLEQWFELSGIDMVDPIVEAQAEADRKKKAAALRTAASRMFVEATRMFEEAAALDGADPVLAHAM